MSYLGELEKFERKPDAPVTCTDFLEEMVDNRMGTIQKVDMSTQTGTVIGPLISIRRFDAMQCWMLMGVQEIDDTMEAYVTTEEPSPEHLGEELWKRDDGYTPERWAKVHVYNLDSDTTMPELVAKMDQMIDPWFRVSAVGNGRIEAQGMEVVDAASDPIGESQ